MRSASSPPNTTGAARSKRRRLPPHDPVPHKFVDKLPRDLKRVIREGEGRVYVTCVNLHRYAANHGIKPCEVPRHLSRSLWSDDPMAKGVDYSPFVHIVGSLFASASSPKNWLELTEIMSSEYLVAKDNMDLLTT